MGIQKGKEFLYRYEYDFAVSGGAIGNISLVPKGDSMIAGMIITDWTISVDTTLAGTASPTVTMGNVGTVNGYAVDFFALGVAGTAIERGQVAGSLLWDDTNDAALAYEISSSANAAPTITVAVHALTAGKFQVYFKAIRPA